MQDKYTFLLQIQTWELTPLPNFQKAISCKWTYHLKYNSLGNINRFKTRLVE
jgi:hypothetical protein